MPPSPAARQVAWSRFVERALDSARARGWDVARILAETGIGKSTLYRWVRGEWDTDPKAGQVRDFCDGLDIPPSAAFTVLWPGKRDRAEATLPPPLDPDLEMVARKLVDPNTPEQEKYLIRETIRALANRPSGSSSPGRRRAS